MSGVDAFEARVATTTVLTIATPIVDGQTVHFSWTTTPRSSLYRRESFSLRFPPSVDVQAVPPSFWKRAALFVLHTHAALLDPCTVVVPWSITDRQATVLNRQIRAVKDTCDFYAENDHCDALSRIEPSDSVTSAPADDPFQAVPRHDMAIAAFSGGRDGMVQAAMLRAAGVPTTLVTVTSAMPTSSDNANSWRRRSLAKAPARLGMRFVEVRSDARSAWRLPWAIERGRATVGVHEVTDQALYAAVCAAVALAQGVGEVFMAAETETHFSTIVQGRVIQYPQLSGTIVTLAALQSLVDDFGLSIRSGTAPFRSRQVSTILARKARDCIDLVATCWRVDSNARACNSCWTCLARGVYLLAEGIHEHEIGADFDRIGEWSQEWSPNWTESRDGSPMQLLLRSISEATLQAISVVSHAQRNDEGRLHDSKRWGWIPALNDRFDGDHVPQHRGWCRDLLGEGGPLLRDIAVRWGDELFGTLSVDGDLVGPSLRLANEFRSTALETANSR